MSNSFRSHNLQQIRFPCPSLSPRICSNSCPLTWWCHPNISSPITLISSCPQSFPASGSFSAKSLAFLYKPLNQFVDVYKDYWDFDCDNVESIDQWMCDILTVLTSLMHEHEISHHIFRSSLIFSMIFLKCSPIDAVYILKVYTCVIVCVCVCNH